MDAKCMPMRDTPQNEEDCILKGGFAVTIKSTYSGARPLSRGSSMWRKFGSHSPLRVSDSSTVSVLTTQGARRPTRLSRMHTPNGTT